MRPIPALQRPQGTLTGSYTPKIGFLSTNSAKHPFAYRPGPDRFATKVVQSPSPNEYTLPSMLGARSTSFGLGEMRFRGDREARSRPSPDAYAVRNMGLPPARSHSIGTLSARFSMDRETVMKPGAKYDASSAERASRLHGRCGVSLSRRSERFKMERRAGADAGPYVAGVDQ